MDATAAALIVAYRDANAAIHIGQVWALAGEDGRAAPYFAAAQRGNG